MRNPTNNTAVERELAAVRQQIKTVQSKGWWLAFEMTPLREKETRLRMRLWKTQYENSKPNS
jgi:hypothetical protein